jgi:DNA-binding transcriptional regulator YbjK
MGIQRIGGMQQDIKMYGRAEHSPEYNAMREKQRQGNAQSAEQKTGNPTERAIMRQYDGAIEGNGVRLIVFYYTSEDVDFSGALGEEILAQFVEQVGRKVRGVFQVHLQLVNDAWLIGSSSRIGEITD